MPTAQQYSDVLPGEQILGDSPPKSALGASPPAYSDVEEGEQLLPAATNPPLEQPKLGNQGGTLPPAKGTLDLGAAPPKPRGTAAGLESEAEERRAAEEPVSAPSKGAGATPEQVQRMLPPPTTLAGGAQPNVQPQESGAVPVPVGPKFTNPGKATPEQAAADIENLKTITGERGYGEIASGLGKLLPPSTAPNPTAKQAEVGATEVLKGAATAATPLMVVGSVLQPEAALLAGGGAIAGGAGAKKLAQVVHASPEVQALAEQAGQIAGGFAGGAAFGGLKHLADPENALTDLLWKRGYIQDNNGHPIYITSQEQARAVASEIIKQNPQDILGSAITKYKAGQAAENVPARQNMGVAEPAGFPKALPAYSDVKPDEEVLPPEEKPPIGAVEPETGRPVLQQSPRPEVTQAAATAEHPAVKEAITNAIKPIDGAELAGARDEKEPERRDEKIEEGQSPRTVRDYSGYRVAVDSPAARDQVVAALKQNFEVHSEQDNFEKGDEDHGFHAHTLNVREPGSPVSHEVQILPREVADTVEDNHDLYEKARDGDTKAAAELKQKNEDIYQQFAARQGAANAVQEQGATRVHERPQEAVGEKGSERGRVESGEQGKDVASASTATASPAKEEEKAGAASGVVRGKPEPAIVTNPPAATEEPRSPADLATRAMLSSKPTPDVGAAARVETEKKLGPVPRKPGQPPKPPKKKETIKPEIGATYKGRSGIDQPYTVTGIKDYGDKDWRGLTVTAKGLDGKERTFSANGIITGNDKLVSPAKGVSNVQPSTVPRERVNGPASQGQSSGTRAGESNQEVQKPDIGVDFDGTLFRENNDGSIGEPIPERIASLKKDLDAGQKVVIESKRAGHPGGEAEIHAALESVGLPRLPVTEKKTAAPKLIDNEAIKESGVKTEKVPTDANTPLPSTSTPAGAKAESDIFAKVKAEHPEWSISQVAQEAAKRANPERKAGQAPKPIEKGPAPGAVGQMKVRDLTLAPSKFQYKLGTDAAGTSTLLKETNVYNPDLAGAISVWRDPADGKWYVINGHHRYELAQRTGQSDIAVRHIVAKDATEARAMGALQNIADGRGTPVDAAKFFRDTNMTAADLKAKGISLGEATANQGLALSNLDEPIFKRVVSGDLRPGRAIAIGEATNDPAEQKAILSLVERKERSGAKVSDDTLSELIRLVKGSEQTTETTADLFGTQEINRSLALEKAEISSSIKQQLAKDRKLFGFVAKEGRAEELARAGNKIEVEKSKEISTQAAQAEEVYNKLSERGGPISGILDAAARRLADGENAGTVKADAYKAVRDEVSKTLGGSEGASAGRPQETSQTAPSLATAEPTLPGLENVPAERAEAVAEQQGKDLTAELTKPPASIESKAGDIEQRSPLFRDTEANPQSGLFFSESGSFEPAKIGEAAQGIAQYLGEVKKATDIARDLQRNLETLGTAKDATVLSAAQTFKTMKKAGLTKADDEAMYHSAEDPTLDLNPKRQTWMQDVGLPIEKQNAEFYKELTDGGVPIEDYVSRSVKDKGGMLDRIAQGIKSVGSKGTLSKNAPQTKARTYMAIENANGDRHVVSVKGGQVTVWNDGTPENIGTVDKSDGAQPFIDKDGNEWKLKQATTKEIERDTDTEYYHSYFASLLSANIQLSSAVRALRFLNEYKASPEFAQTAWKGTPNYTEGRPEAQNLPPKGWQPTKLPQFAGYYFEPRTAEVLDEYADKLRGGQFGALNDVSRFLRAAYLLNPLVHPANVAASWAYEKGLSGFAPWNVVTLYKTGTKAVRAVLSQNQDFLDALEAGGALQSHREDLRDIHKLFFDRLADGLDKKEPRILKVAQALGIDKGNLLNLLHKPSSIAAWDSSDVLYLQAAYQYQAEHSGVSLKDALKEAGRIIPEYRLPTRIADSRTLSKVMGNPLISWFGSYHYGLLKSFAEAGKSALGAQEPAPGRTKAEEVAKGWDRLAMLGLISFVLYPYIFDKAAKLATGDDHARMRRPGAAGYVDAAVQVAQGKQSASSAAQKVVTPSPLTKGAVELGFNRELYSGREIYDPTADWQTQTQQIGRYLLGDFGQYGQYERAATSEQKNRFWWQQAQVQFGKSRAEKVASDIAMSAPRKVETPEDEKNRVQRREILEQLRKGNKEPFEKARAAHELTHRQVLEVERRAKLTPLEDTVYGFSIPEVQKVLDAARADKDQKEIETLSRILRQKRARARAYYESKTPAVQ